MTARIGAGERRGGTPIERALLLVLWASLLNWLVDLLADRRPILLYDLRERFDDYFAFILSFTPHERTAPARWFADRVALSPAPGFPKLAGLEGLPHTALTNFFVTPLTTSYCLVTAALMRIVDPSLLYMATLAGLGAYWLHLVRRFGPPGQRVMLGLLGLLAYPTLQIVTRGNVYAGITALLVIHAMLLAVRGERPVLAAVLLGIAVNIRPNAAPFLLPLLALQPRWRHALIAFGATGAAVLVAGLALAHRLWPVYTAPTFLAGLGNYHWHYVEHAHGVPYGSSLYGALVMLFGAAPWQEATGAAAALAIVAAGTALHLKCPLPPVSLTFLTLAAYTLGSTIIGDYHLLVFVLPLLVAGEGTRAVTVAQVAAALMLAPKNLGAIDGLSVQVVLNPLILLTAAAVVLALEWQARRSPSPRLALA